MCVRFKNLCWENRGPGFDWPCSTTSLREVVLISFIASSSHHPSIHPILFFPPQSSSLLCQSGLPGSTMAIPTQGGAVEGCQTLPMHPTTHTHTHRPVVTSQIPSEGSARLASSLLLPLHLRCSLLLRPLAARPRWNRTAAVQPPCNTSWVPLLPTW